MASGIRAAFGTNIASYDGPRRVATTSESSLLIRGVSRPLGGTVPSTSEADAINSIYGSGCGFHAANINNNEGRHNNSILCQDPTIAAQGGSASRATSTEFETEVAEPFAAIETCMGKMPSVKIESTEEISVDEEKLIDSTILSWEAKGFANSLKMGCLFCSSPHYSWTCP